MKKLLQINAACNTGSTGKIAEQIGLLAESQGWESYIAHSARYARPTRLRDITTSKSVSEKMHYAGTLLTDGHGLYSRQDTKELVGSIKRICPDVIHLHNIHGHYLNYVVLFDYLKEADIPVVWTLHDCWPFTGHCVYFDRIGCEKWRTMCSDCPQRESYPKSLVDRSSRNYELKKKLFTSVSDMTIVPVSDWLHGLVAQSFLAKYPIHTIHNGIDLDKFKPCMSDFRKRYSLEGKFVVLGVADGYGERKGLQDFNRLSQMLGDNAKIVMVGLSEKDKEKVSGNIIGLGRTSTQQELIDIYSAADVFINPTYEDNFPTTNLEALACGTPVVTYRTGGSPEAVDEHTGIVVEKGDLDGLFQAVMGIMVSGKSSYSKACVERAASNYNKADRFREYIELYDSLLYRMLRVGVNLV